MTDRCDIPIVPDRIELFGGPDVKLEVAQDTERSVVIRDHEFTNPDMPWMPCLRCGLAACTHEKIKDVYVSSAPTTATCQNDGCDYLVASRDMTCAAGHIQLNAQVVDV